MCELADSDVVQKLTRLFYNGSHNFILEPLEIESFTWSQQEKFLNATINYDTVKRYPVSAEFCRLFLKKVINYLETNQEVHDDFYKYLCSILKNNTQQEYCYRHYIVENDFKNMITIKETKNMVVNGTTGMRTWQAALMLADYVICNKMLFKGKTILELGSGVGFTGIAIAKYCELKSILLTDCHDDVLKTICDNIKINFPYINPKKCDEVTIFKDNTKNIGHMMLDWNFIENLADHLVPDVLIGADIIYDPTILKPLCTVIKTFCNRNKMIEVYVVNVIRNENTYRQFLDTLDCVGLVYEEIKQINCVVLEWDTNIERCLLKIKLKI